MLTPSSPGDCVQVKGTENGNYCKRLFIVDFLALQEFKYENLLYYNNKTKKNADIICFNLILFYFDGNLLYFEELINYFCYQQLLVNIYLSKNIYIYLNNFNVLI